MEDLLISSTKSTPEVEFCGEGNLRIEGKAITSDPRNFFEPILNWCRGIETNNLNFIIKLEYINTSATKYMMDVIKVLDANNNIKEKAIKWYYEEDDEDMLELGQIFEERTLKTNFYFHEIVEF